MKKFSKILLVVILLFGIGMTGSMFLLTKLVKPEVFKEQLAEAIALKTGRQVSIQGNMGVTIFPKLGATLNDVTLSNSAYFSNQIFAHAGKIEVKVAALPLFLGKVKISKFIFKDLTLNLERKASGVDNWSDLLNYENGDDEASMTNDKSLPELQITNAAFTNANIKFDDYQLAKHVKLEHLNLESNGINLGGHSFSVHAQGRIVNDNPHLDGDFSCDGNVVLDVPNRLYMAQGVRFSGSLITPPLQQRVNFALGANVKVDVNKQEVAIDNLRMQLANAVATGRMHAINIIYAPEVVGDIDIARFDPKPLLKALGILPNVMKKDGEPETLQERAWQSLSLQASIQTTSKFLKVPRLEIHLNDTVVGGSGSYSHFNDKLVVFNFDVNKLNLDQYIPAVASLSSSANNKVSVVNSQRKTKHKLWHAFRRTGSFAHVNKELPDIAHSASPVKIEFLPLLRQIVFNGDIHVGDLQLSGMHFKDVSMQIGSDNGDIDINPFSCKFYQGTIYGELAVNMKKNIPSFNINANISNTRIKSLFEDIFGDEKIDGIGALKFKLTTKGDSRELLLRNLHGSGNLHVVRGMLLGIDVPYQIEKVRALINGVAPQLEESQPPTTHFGQLNANFSLINGVANTRDLLLEAPDFKVKGKGSANLATQNLDMQLEASYINKASFYVPIMVTGTFTSPNIKPDVAVFVGRLLKEAVTQQLKKGVVIKNGKIDASQMVKSIKVDGKSLRGLLSD